MRRQPTEAEQQLWQILRAHRFAGHKFKRQVPIDHYIADFLCAAAKLIVEADGSHHGGPVDTRRDAYLNAQGFRILRFWNNEIFDSQGAVADRILDALSPRPDPSPSRGEGVTGANNG